jgi:hypothetical protein
MRDIVDYIRFNFLKNELKDNHHFYSNSIYLDFETSNDRLYLRDEIIDNINNYYLPFFHNFDRLDD